MNLESRRPFVRDLKGLFKRDSDTPDCALIEEAPDQGDPVRHAAGRHELWKRMLGIRRPVAARFRHLNESGAEGK